MNCKKYHTTIYSKRCEEKGHSWYRVRSVVGEDYSTTVYKRCAVCYAYEELEEEPYEDWGF